MLSFIVPFFPLLSSLVVFGTESRVGWMRKRLVCCLSADPTADLYLSLSLSHLICQTRCHCGVIQLLHFQMQQLLDKHHSFKVLIHYGHDCSNSNLGEVG